MQICIRLPTFANQASFLIDKINARDFNAESEKLTGSLVRKLIAKLVRLKGIQEYLLEVSFGLDEWKTSARNVALF